MKSFYIIAMVILSLCIHIFEAKPRLIFLSPNLSNFPRLPNELDESNQRLIKRLEDVFLSNHPKFKRRPHPLTGGYSSPVPSGVGGITVTDDSSGHGPLLRQECVAWFKEPITDQWKCEMMSTESI